ncbi:MAG: hypothetical protein JWP97_4884 [Labilithrix sp.]|nr:hypothetical protein [Labilithrix sp.]
MPNESAVRFLNVDVDLFGDFDHAALVKGFGDAIVVLHRGASGPVAPVLSFESGAAHAAFPAVVFELIALVHALPAEARAAWDKAGRRVFSIGVQAALSPDTSEWVLTREMMSALVGIDADATLTVYGAERASVAP